MKIIVVIIVIILLIYAFSKKKENFYIGTRDDIQINIYNDDDAYNCLSPYCRRQKWWYNKYTPLPWGNTGRYPRYWNNSYYFDYQRYLDYANYYRYY